MTTPAVFSDAWTRAQAVAEAQKLKLLDPAGQNITVPDGPYWVMETAAGLADRAGAGEPVDLENGTIWLHLLVPKGTGTLEALELRKAMSVAFRQATNLPTGILYRGHMFDPPDLSQTGNRVRFSLGIDYEYQDILT